MGANTSCVSGPPLVFAHRGGPLFDLPTLRQGPEEIKRLRK
jgi:hypothetical protein